MGRHKTGNGKDWPGTAAAFLIFISALLTGSIAHAGDVIVLDVKDAISPPVAAYIIDNIDRAVKEKAEAVVIRIDTPGGLDTSMREIIQKELNDPIPVIVYDRSAPSG